MKLAVLDLGSNSFHLALYRSKGGGRRLVKVARAKEMCRIGAGTLWNGAIDDAAWRRSSAALDRLFRRALGHDPDRLAVVATAGIREASNGAAFCRSARARHGIDIEVLSGEDEASAVYWGARMAMPDEAGRIAVIDVGGGSTEIAVGDGRSCLFAASLPLGVLRLRDLPAEESRARVRATAEQAMGTVRALAPPRIVLTSGTARRLASVALGLGLRRSERDDLGRSALSRIRAALPGLADDELAALGVEDARRDTIAPGALIIDTLVGLTGAASASVVGFGLREGVALRELGRAEAGRRRPAGMLVALRG